jgi:hypothetical protein
MNSRAEANFFQERVFSRVLCIYARSGTCLEISRQESRTSTARPLFLVPSPASSPQASPRWTA